MAGKLAGIGQFLKLARKMQTGVEKAQSQLSKTIVRGQSAQGHVVITGTAKLQCVKVEIDNEILDDKNTIEEEVRDAINSWTGEIENISKEQIVSLSKGFELPPELEAELRDMQEGGEGDK